MPICCWLNVTTYNYKNINAIYIAAGAKRQLNWSRRRAGNIGSSGRVEPPLAFPATPLFFSHLSLNYTYVLLARLTNPSSGMKKFLDTQDIVF
jgi:hypothetical protein